MNGFSLKEFLEFEEKNSFFKRSVNNWNIWEYIRLDVYEDLMCQKSKILGNDKERKSRITASKVWRVFLNCTIRHPRLIAKKRDILIFTNQMRNIENGKYECRITDDIISGLKDRAQAAELIYEIEMGHMEPVKTEHMLRCDYIDVFSELFSRVYMGLEMKHLSVIERECIEIHNLAQRYFNYSFNLEKIVKRAKTVYIRWISKKGKFRRLLMQISPKLIVEVSGYSVSRMIMNEVAHELGIKVLELQHGAINAGHIAYNYAIKRILKSSPDYLFVFSDFWKMNANFIQPLDRVVSVGFPYFDRMYARYPHQKSSTDELRILVISQHIFTDKLLEDINSMIDRLDEHNISYHLIYKMHPRESVVSIRNNKLWRNRNVELIDDPSANIYECFSRSDIQIGVSSSALFEGLGYGLSTYVLHYDTSEEYMGELCKENYAKMVEDGKELANAMIMGNNGHKIDGLYFFKKNALNNAIAEIMKLLGACHNVGS